MRAQVLATLALVLLSGVGAMPPASSAPGEVIIRAAIEGYGDGTVYHPLPIDCVPEDCHVDPPVPQGQWTWVVFDVRRADGTVGSGLELGVYVDYPMSGDYLGFTLRTDEEGSARLLLRPRPPVDTRLEVWAFARGTGSTATFSWLVAGPAPEGPSPPELWIAPDEAWWEVEITTLRREFFEFFITTLWDGSSDAAASAHFLQFEYQRPGGGAYRLAHWRAANEDADLALGFATAVSPEVSAGVNVQEVEFALSDGGRSFRAQGWMEAGTRVHLVIARSGLESDRRLGLSIFGDDSAYDLDILGHGPLHVSEPSLGPSLSVSASGSGFGAHRGTFRSTLTVPDAPDTLVFGGGVAALGGRGDLEVAYEGQSIRRRVAAGEGIAFNRFGDCGGDWSVTMTGYQGLQRPTAVAVAAEGLPLAEWARTGLQIPAQLTCSLSASGP